MTDELVTRYKFAQLVGCSRQHISNLVQKGVLPDLPNKKIPLKSGMEAFKHSSTKQFEKHSPPSQKSQLSRNEEGANIINVPENNDCYIKEYTFKNHNIKLMDFDGYSSVDVDNGYFKIASNEIDNIPTATITLSATCDLIEIELVNDADYKKVLSDRKTIEGFGNSYFLLKESELIEFITSKKK